MHRQQLPSGFCRLPRHLCLPIERRPVGAGARACREWEARRSPVLHQSKREPGHLGVETFAPCLSREAVALEEKPAPAPKLLLGEGIQYARRHTSRLRLTCEPIFFLRRSGAPAPQGTWAFWRPLAQPLTAARRSWVSTPKPPMPRCCWCGTSLGVTRRRRRPGKALSSSEQQRS